MEATFPGSLWQREALTWRVKPLFACLLLPAGSGHCLDSHNLPGAYQQEPSLGKKGSGGAGIPSTRQETLLSTHILLASSQTPASTSAPATARLLAGWRMQLQLHLDSSGGSQW